MPVREERDVPLVPEDDVRREVGVTVDDPADEARARPHPLDVGRQVDLDAPIVGHEASQLMSLGRR
jgi:hypothetical protein